MPSTIKRYENRQPGYTDPYTIRFYCDPAPDYYPDGVDRYGIFCLNHPQNPYSDAEVHTHLDPKTGQICVAPGRMPHTMEMAEAIAYLWMRGYSQYIRTGKFPE